jgi:hypothetical protein
MKKVVWIAMLILFGGNAFSQWYGYYIPDRGSELDAGLGMTWVDNQAYYVISFHPDIGIGKFGIGLGINLLYNAETGRIRAKDWNSAYDYARIIRYLRYGYKGDRFYSRVGALDAERIGHGFIMNFYNNQLYYDERKLGLTLDIDFGRFGFESLTNNLGRLEVIGGRGYLRPLFDLRIPVLKDFAVGASYVTDVDPDSWRGTKDGVSVWGADVELPLIRSDFMRVLLYADYARIKDYGGGKAVGFQTDFHALFDFLKFGFNVERRFLGKEFIANYFGPFYEVLRYSTLGELIHFYESMGGDAVGITEELLPVIETIPVNQQMLLPMMTAKRKGWYAGLYLDFLHLIRVFGSYQRIDGRDRSGMLHMGAGLSPSIPFLALEATYDKWGIGSFKDFRTLNYQSVARVGIGYKIKSFLLLYLDYIWSFEWDEGLGQYKPQERFQPRLAFRYHFGAY